MSLDSVQMQIAEVANSCPKCCTSCFVPSQRSFQSADICPVRLHYIRLRPFQRHHQGSLRLLGLSGQAWRCRHQSIRHRQWLQAYRHQRCRSFRAQLPHRTRWNFYDRWPHPTPSMKSRLREEQMDLTQPIRLAFPRILTLNDRSLGLQRHSFR